MNALIKSAFCCLFIAGVLCGATDNNTNKHLTVSSFFADNMVLQQRTKVTIKGTALSGASVRILPGWSKESVAKADTRGAWQVQLKTPSAGGPYLLSFISGADTLTLNNILIGEVWLCSGQSNMEMPLSGYLPNDSIFGAQTEFAGAPYPLLRFYKVERNLSPEPLNEVKGLWQQANNMRMRQLSATAYFFAQKLIQKLKVPVGLIVSAWGGTPVESWIPVEDLTAYPEYKNLSEELKSAYSRTEEHLQRLKQFRQIPINNVDDDNIWKNLVLNDDGFASPSFDATQWKKVSMPDNFDNIGLKTFDGVVWFRKQITLPDDMVNKELVLSLGPIDDIDATAINGTKIGGYEKSGYWNKERLYTIPAQLNTQKTLTITVRVVDYLQGGGFYGTADNFYVGLKGSNRKETLAGTWLCAPVAEYRNNTVYVYPQGEHNIAYNNGIAREINSSAPSVLYNAMIAPLNDFPVRGAIWYQGESNTGNAGEYTSLFSTLIKSWRKIRGGTLPFYFTQIAPFNYGSTTQSGELRNAQTQTLSLPSTGMAVTLDIGDAGNIHPANKKDVGERLALWALAKTYSIAGECSGPLCTKAERKNNDLILSFTHSDGMYIKLINGRNHFKVAGADSIFYDATAEIQGNKIKVSSVYVSQPVQVWYCYGNTEAATLFNKQGLPAGTFYVSVPLEKKK